MWLLFAALSAFFWASSDIISRYFSHINALLATACISFGMLVISLTLYFFTENKLIETFHTDLKSLVWISVAGLINGIGFFFFFKFFQAGGNFTQGFPITLILLSLVAVIYGVIFFKDPLSLKIGAGFFAALLAIYLLN